MAGTVSTAVAAVRHRPVAAVVDGIGIGTGIGIGLGRRRSQDRQRGVPLGIAAALREEGEAVEAAEAVEAVAFVQALGHRLGSWQLVAGQG